MVQLHNFFFFITSMVAPLGTAAPVLFQFIFSRDVSTGAPFSNGTIIPILIPSFPLLVYLHSRQFIGSADGRKSGVLVRESRPILLPDIIVRSSSERSARKALFPFVPLLHFLLLESKGDFSYLSSFCGVLRLLFFLTFFFLPRDRSALRERARRRKGQRKMLERDEQGRNKKTRCFFQHLQRRVEGKEGKEIAQILSVGKDYYQFWNIPILFSHVGVCIFSLGVLLSNTSKIEFTQRLPLGVELNMGKERCSFRGLDHLHGPTFQSICGNFMIYKASLTKTNDRLMKEHDSSLLFDLLSIDSYENRKLPHLLHRLIKNREHNRLTMFPEKRYFRESTSTTEVAIHTNWFTDLYASIGTGSARTGGWYTTIIQMPFIFFIRIGFLLAYLGGYKSLIRQIKKQKLTFF